MKFHSYSYDRIKQLKKHRYNLDSAIKSQILIGYIPNGQVKFLKKNERDTDLRQKM